MQKNLQYAIVGKFLCGKPDISTLRKNILSQYGINQEYNIGVLDTRHVSIRLTSLEDFV